MEGIDHDARSFKETTSADTFTQEQSVRWYGGVAALFDPGNNRFTSGRIERDTDR